MNRPPDTRDTAVSGATATPDETTASASAQRRTGRRRMMEKVVVLAVAAFALAGLILAFTSAEPTTPEDDVRSIAMTLRCPSCAGEAVADSPAPLAQSMRIVITDQRAQGRSADEIRSWFAQRYGPGVLLDPPRQDVGLALWLVPLLVVAVAAVVVALLFAAKGRHRVLAGTGAALVAVAVTVAGWGLTTTASPAEPTAVDAAIDPTDVLRDAAARDPARIGLRAALASRLVGQERYAEAADEFAAVARLTPLDAQAHFDEGFARFRAGDLEGARAALEQACTVDPDHVETLLLLGTLLHRADDPEANTVLHRFIALAPGHTAAPMVRAWLAGQEATP